MDPPVNDKSDEVTKLFVGIAIGGKGISTGTKIAKGIYAVDATAGTAIALKASDLKMSKTVQNHIMDIIKKGENKGLLARPYIDSNGTNLLIDEIMNAGSPVKDATLKNGLRWDVEGTFMGSQEHGS